MQAAKAAPSFMKAMYDSCLREGLFPKKWKEARVVALLKGADKDRAEPRSYRPLSLLSGLGKILERMLIERLLTPMDGKWNKRQFGFVKSKCTENAWAKAKDLVNASSSKHVVGVLVDFKGAFAYLLLRVIISNSKHAGCRVEEIAVWRNYFADRLACMNNGVDECIKRVERGYPQGSIGGPSLWKLCMNDLLNELCELRVKAVAYADDLLLLAEGAERTLVEQRASEAMRVVYLGASASVSTSRTRKLCMVLKGGLSMLNQRVHVALHENASREIGFVECVKYLGVNMSMEMNFRVHVNDLRRLVSGTVGKLRRVMRKDWGLKRTTVSVLVKGLLTPAVIYGASAVCMH